MSGHPSCHRVNRIVDLDASLLECQGQLLGDVLGLGDREAIPRDDDHLLGVGKEDPDVLRVARAVAPGIGGPIVALSDTRNRLTDRCKEHIAKASTHRIGHHLGEQGPRGPHERATDDETGVADRKTTRSDRHSGKGIEHGDHHRHVGPTDRQDEGEAKDEGDHQQYPER